MIGALLLFMMMAANFQNALNDYGIRSNAFMNGVIASGSNGSGSDAGIPIPEGFLFVVQIGEIMHYKYEKTGPGTKRECKEGWGFCLWSDPECCLSRTFGICTD